MPQKSVGMSTDAENLANNKIKIDPKVTTLAGLIIKRQSQKQGTYSILLGAGASVESGKLLWPRLAEGLSADLGADSREQLFEILEGITKNSDDFYSALKDLLKDTSPSVGYYYLAHLISQEFFDRIFTTNWDNLLESALVGNLSYSDFKVIIRGETDRKQFQRILASPTPRIKIVKLHGDLESKVFDVTDKDLFKLKDDNRTMSLLRSYLSKDIIIVGHGINDPDIQKALSYKKGKGGRIWYVSPNEPESGSFIYDTMKERGCVDNFIKAGFDDFFIQLGLEIGRLKIERQGTSKRQFIEVLDRFEKGANYYSNYYVEELVNEMCALIKGKKFRPDLIVYIYDPDAPGGSEVRHTMERNNYFPDAMVQQITIEGRFDRVKARHAHSLEALDKIKSINAPKILLIDSITFSGNTIKLAVDELIRTYGEVLIKMGFLVVGKTFIEDFEKDDKFGHIKLKDVFYVEKTDRLEIYFPWGYTQSTARTAREFPLNDDEKRIIDCLKRPWGNMEIFSENTVNTVKLLTINAGQCLSKQRHYYRDELFIAVDDNVGFQIEEKRVVLEKGDYIIIPRGVIHRVFAYKNSARVLEVIYGFYDQIYDIERFEDKYNRVDSNGKV